MRATHGFQSTLPAGEATLASPALLPQTVHFNPRFPRGKRRFPAHCPLECLQFQSTLPAGEATDCYNWLRCVLAISIHASRGGSDVATRSLHVLENYFNPRFPRGKRPGTVVGCPPAARRFQSTLPAGEATAHCMFHRCGVRISIHASRGGSDMQKSMIF